MTWKTMVAFVVVAVVVTGPVTGSWGLVVPVNSSPDGQILLDCGTALHEHAPLLRGQMPPIPEPPSACDGPVAEERVLSFSLIGVGLASWMVIAVVLIRRRRARRAFAPARRAVVQRDVKEPVIARTLSTRVGLVPPMR